jgi:hypothetical protein
MRRFLAAVGALESLSFLGGLLYVVINGSLPPSVSDAFTAMQTAALILLVILAAPAIVLVYLIVESQIQPPMSER